MLLRAGWKRPTYCARSYCQTKELVTQEEDDIDWQHPVDKKDIPIELMRMHDGNLTCVFLD
jgi:hypothetical protein